MNPDAEVIVVGAGPAGTMAAWTLASGGISVLLLEKSTFPRYKVCGGGLTHKVLAEIPFDLSGILQTSITSICFSSRLGNSFTRKSPVPLMYCTMRSELDHFLLQKAEMAGVKVRTGEPVTGIEMRNEEITVITKSGKYTSRIVIGADGAAGTVSRKTGLSKSIEQGMAWEAEISADPADLKTFADTVFLDWGTLPGGYAWIFPKKDHFSVGVGGPARLSGVMIPYYDRFLFSVGKDNPQPATLKTALFGSSEPASLIRFHETFSLRSWPIPVRTAKGRFHSGNVLVTGDAAGLGDPLTGEGIYYAVRSGNLAAESCLDYLSGRTADLATYSEKVNEELMTELLEANRIRHLFNAVPMKIHTFVRDSDRAWRAFGKVLRGERWYRDVKNGFGKWRYLWAGACSLAGILEKRKERKILKRDPAG